MWFVSLWTTEPKGMSCAGLFEKKLSRPVGRIGKKLSSFGLQYCQPRNGLRDVPYDWAWAGVFVLEVARFLHPQTTRWVGGQ